MNKIIGAAVGLLFAASAPAQLVVDHFAYGNGNLGNPGIGDTIWTGGDSPNVSLVVNSNAALSYPALFGATGSGVIFSGGTFKKKAAPFTAQSGNGVSVYCSFLLNIQTAGSGSKLIAYLQDGNSASGSPPLGIFINGNQLGLAKSASTPPVNTTLAAGTHLIVARYAFQAGNDRVDLWIDPTALGTNAVIPPATLTTGTGSSSDAASLSYLFLNHAVNQTIWLDEARVGTSWADVTPTDGIPQPPASAPRFTEVLMTANDLILRGIDGPPNGAFDLLSAPDIAAPSGLWDEIASDNFDLSGHFDITNPVTPGASRQFYRLRVGNGTPPPIAPQITIGPTNLTVLANQNAVFTVVATGTAPLSYQWYFNTNTLLAGKTAATLTLNNVQTNNAGGYSVIVTNIAGSVTSIVATLTVSNILAAPTITTEPQSQSVTEGQTAVFSIATAGTPPLTYQWYFNTNTLLTDRTNASLTLNNVSTNDAGFYSVNITNDFGFTNSAFASLTVNPSSGNIDFSHVGFGNLDFTVTGAGSNAPSIIVTTGDQLAAAADSNTNVIIYVSGTLQISGMSTHVRPNKTLIGLGTNAILEGGGLYLYRSTNVIIRNLTIRNSSEDNIGLHYSSNIWIDHCTIVDAADGGIDLTQESDKVTLSWCRFYYTSKPPGNHNFVNLMGASDGESGSIGKLRVTFHHNWWDTNCQERLPSVRFGRAHVFNNYYNAPGNNYCVRTRLYAESRIENNWFENVKNPWEVYITSGPAGLVYASGNAEVNTTHVANPPGILIPPGTDPVFVPPYSYTLDPAPALPNLVTQNAGAGKGPFAP